MDGIIIIIVIVIGAIIITTKVKHNKLSYKYGNAVIEVLEAYKDGKLTSENAAKQLYDLYEITSKESDSLRNNDFDEAHKLSLISTKAFSAYQDLHFKKDLSIIKINDYIKYIKNEA